MSGIPARSLVPPLLLSIGVTAAWCWWGASTIATTHGHSGEPILIALLFAIGSVVVALLLSLATKFLTQNRTDGAGARLARGVFAGSLAVSLFSIAAALFPHSL